MSPVEMVPADRVPLRRLDARVRKFRGHVYIAREQSAIEVNEVALFIFKSIDGVSTMRQIAEKIAAEYGIGYEVAFADSSELVGQLVEFGVVETAS